MTQNGEMSLRDRIAQRFFGDYIQRQINAAVSVRVDDSAGWDPLSGGGPHDRPWSELRDDLDDRSVRTFVKLADYFYLAGDTPRALDAVHEVLALDPDNKAAEGLRERILDRGDPVRADGDMAWPVLASRRGIYFPGWRGGGGSGRFKPAYHAFPYPRRTFHTYPKPWRYHWYAVQLGLP